MEIDFGVRIAEVGTSEEIIQCATLAELLLFVWITLPKFAEFCDSFHVVIHIGLDAILMSGMERVDSIIFSGFGIVNSSLRAYDVSEVVVIAFRYVYQAGEIMKFFFFKQKTAYEMRV